MSQNLSSAAVMIGTLMANLSERLVKVMLLAATVASIHPTTYAQEN